VTDFAFDCSDKTLLLVDDDPASLQALSGYLDGQGFGLIMAGSGESAIDKARRMHPDLILLDVSMPVLDGYETCRRLKSDPQTRDIPVIFLSALGDADDGPPGLECGGCDFVTKPFQGRELLGRIAVHLTLGGLQSRLRERNVELEDRNRLLRDSLERYEGAKSALGESEARNRLLLDSTQEGIVGVGRDGRCTFCNRAAARMLGFDDPQALVGEDVLPLTHTCHDQGGHAPEEPCPVQAAYLHGKAN
jgi:DNA-binding response OmpR family regulator